MLRSGAKTTLLPATFILLAVTVILFALNGSARTPVASLPSETIRCRVLESHTNLQLGVTLVIFRHRDPTQCAPLGTSLRAHSGHAAEFQTSDGCWHEATVLRLKSCFGRGLLIFSSKEAQLAEKDEFILQFSSSGLR